MFFFSFFFYLLVAMKIAEEVGMALKQQPLTHILVLLLQMMAPHQRGSLRLLGLQTGHSTQQISYLTC